MPAIKDKAKPTFRQKKAFIAITEKHRSVSGAMRDVGYSESSATKPSNLTESKGFIALMEAQGLTDEFLNECLKEDIIAKKANRKPELELAYRLKSKLTDSKEGNTVQVAIQAINYIVPQERPLDNN